MAQTYTVLKGDTLGAIAKKYNVKVSDIGGYRSGNPNLIYPGENLSIGGAGGGSTTTTPSTTSQDSSAQGSSAPSSVDYSSFYKAAASMIQPIDTSAVTTAAQSTADAYAAKAKAITESIPTVQNIYTNLAAQLELQQKQETETVQKEKTQELGKEAQSAAVSGFETSSGYEAALSRSISEDFNKKISTVADKYGLKAEDLKNEEVKDISTLTSEAQDALIAGDQTVADANFKLVQIKQNEQDLIRQTAANLMTAANNSEKNYYMDLYRQAQIDLAEAKTQAIVDKTNGKGSGSGATQDDIDSYAQTVADASLDTSEVASHLGQVPSKIRAQVADAARKLIADREQQKKQEKASKSSSKSGGSWWDNVVKFFTPGQ